jgi:hypothetical protein
MKIVLVMTALVLAFGLNSDHTVDTQAFSDIAYEGGGTDTGNGLIAVQLAPCSNEDRFPLSFYDHQRLTGNLQSGNVPRGHPYLKKYART